MERVGRTVRILTWCLMIAGAVLSAGVVGPPQPPRITVMTWNIYYGGGGSVSFDLGETFERVKATDFTQRAARIARIIDQQQPQIIALQEVARWRTETFLGHDEDDIDFLPILLARLAARGLTYDIVGALETIDFEAPGEVDGDLLNIHWEERIVMLARRSASLSVGKVRTRHYDDIEVIDTPVGDLAFNRGWISADITWKGRTARYVCTHLEAISNTTRAQQAAELIDWLDGVNRPVILMGDFNALPLSGEHQQFIDAQFADAWTDDHGEFEGPTCCQSGDLENQSSELNRRIDYVMLRGDATAVSSTRVGQRQADKTPGGLWPSDHAGVVMKVRLP